MNLRTLLVTFALVLAIAAPAQLSTEQRQKRATEIMTKARQVDLLNQIMPLLLTTKQIDQILPALDKIRNEQRKMELAEFDALTKIEKKLDDAIADSIKNGRSPNGALIAEMFGTFRMFQMRRGAESGEAMAELIAVVNKTLNEGQKKAMKGALRPSLIDPSIDPKTLTDERRMQFFCQVVLLDPAAYSLLSRMAAKK